MARRDGTLIRKRRAVEEDIRQLIAVVDTLREEAMSLREFSNSAAPTVATARSGMAIGRETAEDRANSLNEKYYGFVERLSSLIEGSFDSQTCESIYQVNWSQHSDTYSNRTDLSAWIGTYLSGLFDLDQTVRSILSDLPGYGEAEFLQLLAPARPHNHQNTAQPSGIIVVYSKRNRRWLDRVKAHLASLAPTGGIDVWDDTRIRPGADWRQEMQVALSSASIAVILLSADFLASDFVTSMELAAILAAHTTRGLRICPIFVSPCHVPQALLKFQAVNSMTRTLSEVPAAEADRVLASFVMMLHKERGHVP